MTETELALPVSESLHATNNRVFGDGWAERLVLTQLSRYYNQAVLERLRDQEHTQVFVPHSDAERGDSRCTRVLAGGTHDLATLYDRLIHAYRDGVWSSEVKIPNHPHCSHVVAPLR